MVAVTDTLFLYTEGEGLIRPSDADGLRVLCDDGSYHPVSVKPFKMTKYWTLFFTNGMLMELDDYTSIMNVDKKYVGEEDFVIGMSVTSDDLRFSKPASEYIIDLEEVTSFKTGEIDLFDCDFGYLAGNFATSAMSLKSHVIKFKSGVRAVAKKILDKYDVKYTVEGDRIVLRPCWMSDLLVSCFGDTCKGSKERHYIPDSILLSCPEEWAKEFVRASLNTYAPCYVSWVQKRGFYHNFMSGSHKFVNDLAHLLYKCNEFNYEFILLEEGNYFRKHDFKATSLGKNKLTDVSISQGLRYNIPTIGYKVEFQDKCDRGMYLSGFYVK